MNGKRQNGTSPAVDLSVIAALITVLITALVYTAGWAYAYRWYGQFSVGVIGLEIPPEYHFMYGFWSVRDFWWALLLYLAPVAAWHWWRPQLGPWVWRLAPVWALLLFVGAYGIGSSAASGDFRRHLASGFAVFPLARVWLAPSTGRDSALDRFAGELKELRYRLLLQTKDKLYLIKPKIHAVPPVVLVPIGRVEALRVTPTNPGL